MNPSLFSPLLARKFSYWIFFSLLLTPWLSSGQIAPTNLTCLLVVDSSFSMRQQKQILTELISQLTLNGMQNTLQTGDQFALWTFNEQVQKRPPISWTPEEAQPLSHALAQSLSALRFEKRSRIDRAIAELHPVIAASSHLTILLFSDPGSRLKGTPFDPQINALFAQHSRRARQLKRPFVTAFSIRDGHMIAWSVGIGGPQIEVPSGRRSAGPPAPTASPITLAHSSPVPAQTPASNATVQSTIPSPPAIPTPTPQTHLQAPPPAPPEIVKTANALLATKPEPILVPLAPAEILSSPGSPAVSPPIVEQRNPPIPINPEQGQSPSLPSTNTPLPLQPQPTTTEPAPLAVSAPTQSPLLLALVAIALTILALALLLVHFRKKRSSLISQSMGSTSRSKHPSGG